jgi:hypothetical protein
MIQTREQWLIAAVEAVKPLFAEIDVVLPPVHVSCGWPSSRATATKNQTIGECWKTHTSDDKVSQIFISPVLADPKDVLGVLIHELIHAWDNGASGHKGNRKQGTGFAGKAHAIGLVGKMTATTVGEELGLKLLPIYYELGSYPHAAIHPGGNVKKQSTRMLKLEAPDCGYIVRTTAKWLDSEGFPKCPHGTEMELA